MSVNDPASNIERALSWAYKMGAERATQADYAAAVKAQNATIVQLNDQILAIQLRQAEVAEEIAEAFQKAIASWKIVRRPDKVWKLVQHGQKQQRRRG